VAALAVRSDRVRRVDDHLVGELSGGLQVTAGQEKVLTAGREVRRERAADVAGADDGDRAIRNSHLVHLSGSGFRKKPARAGPDAL
jgi:hypothetical protein